MRNELMLKANHHIIRSFMVLKNESKKKLITNKLLDQSFNRVYRGIIHPSRMSDPDEKDALEEIKEILDEENQEDGVRIDLMNTKDAYVKAHEDDRDV